MEFQTNIKYLTIVLMRFLMCDYIMNVIINNGKERAYLKSFTSHPTYSFLNLQSLRYKIRDTLVSCTREKILHFQTYHIS